MASSSKKKASGVSLGSFLDLKAEVTKQETEWQKNRAAGKEKYIVGGIKRPDKKPTVWSRKNKGVASRSARDYELEALEKPVLEVAQAALERKAKIYDKLKRGKTGGLSDKQYESLLVDFDAKAMEDHYSSGSEDVDESLTVPRPYANDAKDPMVEYQDEFGRMRTAPRSEVPRDLLPPEYEEDEEDHEIIYNPKAHFPVFEPTAERKEAILAAASEEANPLATHYDASREVRTKGAAFYRFSADEEKRQREMDELRAAREETQKERQETDAVDLLPGDIEGMVVPEEEAERIAAKAKSEAGVRSRAMEKRKREIEERRKLLDAKRRKAKGGEDDQAMAAPLFLMPLHAEPSWAVTPVRQDKGDDPFATVERSKMSRRSPEPKRNEHRTHQAHDADEFLQNLEKDMMMTRKN